MIQPLSHNSRARNCGAFMLSVDKEFFDRFIYTFPLDSKQKRKRLISSRITKVRSVIRCGMSFCMVLHTQSNPNASFRLLFELLGNSFYSRLGIIAADRPRRILIGWVRCESWLSSILLLWQSQGAHRQGIRDTVM